MIFKLVITDQKQKISAFTFQGGSISEVIDQLENLYGDTITENPTEDAHRAVLYNIQFELEGEDEDTLIENLTNPDFAHAMKTWHLEDIEPIEHDLRDYLDLNNVFAQMGVE